MSEMIERVEDAIKRELATLNVEVVCQMAREAAPCDMTPFRLLAEAAIAAMREPVEAMLAVAERLTLPAGIASGSPVPLPPEPDVAWRAMIDAALEP